MHVQLNPDEKKKVLLYLLKNHGQILINNEMTDALQVFFSDKKGSFLLDHWSPRENLTYSQDVISTQEAHGYAEKYCLGKLEKSLVELGYKVN